MFICLSCLQEIEGCDIWRLDEWDFELILEKETEEQIQVKQQAIRGRDEEEI